MTTPPNSSTALPDPPRANAWLSQGFEHLARRLPAAAGRAHTDFDVLVIGSGYGGAIAAASLAGAGCAGSARITLGVLERGKEYLPGAFPARTADLAGHVRFSTARDGKPRGNREGLFDVRIGPDLVALVASGLGGGSLINAGVMATPSAQQLHGLPIEYEELAPYFTEASRLLGASSADGPNTILSRGGRPPPAKYAALERLGQGLPSPVAVKPVPVTVAMQDKFNAAGVGLDACIGCGDCATGCNFNAKDSLDSNLLVTAQRQGAELFSGATVLRLTHEAAEEGAPERWCAHVVFTDPVLRKKHKHPFRVYCSKLVLAAGTFGSTEILLRSRSETLGFSPLLGQKFSGNGDMIMVAYDEPAPVDAVADEDRDPRQRDIGPTITGMLDTGAFLIEELAVPGPLRRVFEEIVTTANTLHLLAEGDASEHGADGSLPDPCAVDANAIRNSAILALMGDDGAGGAIELTGTGKHDADGDGAVRVRWPGLRHSKLFLDQLALLEAYAAARPGGGRILPNPMWKLLPAKLAYLLTNQHGPPMTVHPLGGCPMGGSMQSGVVNALGQVFGRTPGPGGDDGLLRSVVVLDGAVIPKALGVNPALTIAAVALRAARHLRAEWGWSNPVEATKQDRRPRFQIVEPPVPKADTVVEFVERMSGPMTLETTAGDTRDCVVELTMPFRAQSLAALVLPRDGRAVGLRRELALGPAARVNVYDKGQWDAWKLSRDQTVEERPAPLASASLTGTLALFHRAPSRRWGRTWRAFVPWLLNRGLRDTWQWAEERIREGGFFSRKPGGKGPLEDGRERFAIALALASRAGEVRLFEYDLQMGALSQADPAFAGIAARRQAIHGVKRITYGRASNPWKQLTRLTLDAFPSLAPRSARLLELDTAFLVNEDIPLMRILSQQDQPGALGDVAAMGGYLLRLLLSVHIWSFRKPDPAPQRSAQRLPASIRGLPEPRIRELEVGVLPNGAPVFACLTRYKRDDMPATLAPVMMIHGYSASGTSFAHPLVTPSLASHLWNAGHDVWILDMRTSSAMPTARHPWSFEDAAHADIPAAVDHICRETGRATIDVVAHCMGAAMFGMAVLGTPESGAPFYNERSLLPGRIKRVVLSQVGPLVVFSQANIFRAYLMGYLNRVLPMAGYTFRVEGEPTLADELLDRLLATLPYPDQEFHLENPVWPWRRTPFVGTRHRMDALYGRDFSLGNVDPRVLENIDDFFGPLSIDTVSQAIHLARQKTICNRGGRNVYVSRRKLKERWTFETLSVHGADNGLADVATLGRMRAVFADAEVRTPLHVEAFAGFGHQDCLIGRDAIKVHAKIAEFLAGRRVPPAAAPDLAPGTPVRQSRGPLLARIPHAGPVRSGFASMRGDGALRSDVGCTATPVLPDALLVLFLPVAEQDGRFRFAGTPGAGGGIFPQEMELYAAVGDGNGFMTFSHRPAPANAEGMLMLILYDANELMDTGLLPSDLFKDPRLAGFDLMSAWRMAPAASLVASAMAPLLPPGGLLIPPLALLQQVMAMLDRIAGHIHGAVAAEMARMPAAELRRALLTASPHDGGAQGGVAPAASTVCFALASCQYPAGMLDQAPAFASYERLAALLDQPGDGVRPGFLILTGDQIYADATAGLFDPTDSDDRYVRPYEKLLSNRHVRSVFSRLPVFMLMDDHEIADNWERDTDPLAPDDRWSTGRRSYLAYQRTTRPPWKERLWTGMQAGGIHFFMADTRSERGPRTLATGAEAHIMSEEQWQAMKDWLQDQRDCEPPGKPRFIVTPSILGPRRLGGHGQQGDEASLRSDAWEGYPASRDRLLAHIAALGLENLVFLSGDEHISVDASITLSVADEGTGTRTTVIRSIHSSALYAPYPFANASRADFADDRDGFSFADPAWPGRMVDCSVRSRFHPGDGFAVLTLAQGASGAWTLDCRFDRAPSECRHPPG